MTTILMVDATHAAVGRVPLTVPKVAGYVTGSPDIKWSAADWARFPHVGQVRINQGNGTVGLAGYDVLDVESGAVTPVGAARAVRDRVHAGIAATTVYGSSSALAATRAALDALGAGGWWHGHADAWLADWNLNAARAAAVVGTAVHGLTVRAVQWASPSSNPGTILPGSHLTLAQANADLSAADAGWHAAPGYVAPVFARPTSTAYAPAPKAPATAPVPPPATAGISTSPRVAATARVPVAPVAAGYAAADVAAGPSGPPTIGGQLRQVLTVAGVAAVIILVWMANVKHPPKAGKMTTGGK